VFAGSRRRGLRDVFVVIAGVAVLYLLLPQLAGLGETWARIERGTRGGWRWRWRARSRPFGGYVAVFRGVFAGRQSRLDWRASYQITMAGLAAHGCSARAAPAASRSPPGRCAARGWPRRDVADACIAFLVLTYAVYVGAMVLAAIGLRTGVLQRAGPVRDDGRPGGRRPPCGPPDAERARAAPDLERRLRHRCERGDRIGLLGRAARARAIGPARGCP
jgi:hypothetical protein